MSENYCVGKFIVSGLSNGGMMTYSVSHGAPDLFDAFMPVQGLDLTGYLDLPAPVASKPILHIHARQDQTIPVAGGTAQGYIYVSLEDAMHDWAENHGCDLKTEELKTEWSHKFLERNLECRQFLNCDTPVDYCLYDGLHGSWPSYIEALQVWWLSTKANVLSGIHQKRNDV